MRLTASPRGVRLPRWLALLVVAAAIVFCWSVPQMGAQTETVERAAAFDRLTEKAVVQGRVPVIIRLAVPGIERLTAASVSAPIADPDPRAELARITADGALARAIGEVADPLIDRLGSLGHVNRRYASIPFLALTVTPEALAVLRQSASVLGIEEDVPVPVPPRDQPSAPLDAADLPALNNTVNFTGASTAWRWGYTGAHWYVAIVDSGIRSTHQLFAGKHIFEACFALGSDQLLGAGDCPNGLSEQEGPGSARHHPSWYEGYDHGTHVAGIAAGNSSRLLGVAPAAGIIAILTGSKWGNRLAYWPSDTAAALDWLYQRRGIYRVAAVNMSLGGGHFTSPCDSGSWHKAAIDNLRAVGIGTVIASGNEASCVGVAEPACVSSAVTVGASTDSDGEWFRNGRVGNNWHPTMQKLFAPGEQVYSAVGASDTSYDSWDGTSMAAPHVAGAWALLKQAVPNGSVTDLLGAMRSTGVGITSVCDGRRTAIPRFRVDRAITALTTAQAPTPTPSPTPGVTCGGCTGAAPVAGWVCVNGGWVYPTHPSAGACTGAPPTPTPSPTPTPTPTPTPSPTPGVTCGGCATPTPVAGWVCVNGGWVYPTHPSAGACTGVPPTPTPTPAPTPTPTPTPAPTPSPGVTCGGCTTTSPGTGWVCVNGGWLPPGHPAGAACVSGATRR